MDNGEQLEHEVLLDQWVDAVIRAYPVGMDHQDLEVRGVPGAYVVRAGLVDREVLAEWMVLRAHLGFQALRAQLARRGLYSLWSQFISDNQLTETWRSPSAWPRDSD